MDNNWQLRQACADAVRRCEQAEQTARQTQEAAERQRQAALADARQQHAQARQQAEAIRRDVGSLLQQGDAILVSLNLAPKSSTPFTVPSGASLDELARLLQNQRSQAREALTRLKTTAEALKEERRKWWKFW